MTASGWAHPDTIRVLKRCEVRVRVAALTPPLPPRRRRQPEGRPPPPLPGRHRRLRVGVAAAAWAGREPPQMVGRLRVRLSWQSHSRLPGGCTSRGRSAAAALEPVVPGSEWAPNRARAAT